MYLINMPLFVINELHLNKELAGTLMGTAADGNPCDDIAGLSHQIFQ